MRRGGSHGQGPGPGEVELHPGAGLPTTPHKAFPKAEEREEGHPGARRGLEHPEALSVLPSGETPSALCPCQTCVRACALSVSLCIMRHCEPASRRL